MKQVATSQGWRKRGTPPTPSSRHGVAVNSRHHELHIESFFAHALVVVSNRESDVKKRRNQAAGDKISEIHQAIHPQRRLAVRRKQSRKRDGGNSNRPTDRITKPHKYKHVQQNP